MVPIKVECDCGQHYAFDVEPVNGCMPSAIACPECGADGTASANEAITRHLGPRATQPAITVAASAPRPAAAIHLAEPVVPVTVAPKIQLHASQLGIITREQAEIEAAAKISWGDTPEAVISYLMMQKFSHEEASEIVGELMKKRMLQVRAIGVRKIFLGLSMMLVPVVAWILNMMMISFIIMSMAVGVGVWGFFKVVIGIMTVVAPKIQTGDVAED